MRKLLTQLRDIDNYIDDVLTHTSDLSKHIAAVREFFIGIHGLSPCPDIITKITDAPRPQTVKQL